MNGLLRRIRGVVSTGIVWALGWGVAFMGLHLFGLDMFATFWEDALAGSILGFLGGGSFAVILSVLERRRRLDQLSLGRVGLWGAIGGTAVAYWFMGPSQWSAFSVFPDIFIQIAFLLGSGGLLGAGFSVGSVAIARQGDKKLIEGDDGSVPSLDPDLEPERIG